MKVKIKKKEQKKRNKKALKIIVFTYKNHKKMFVD